MLCNELFQEGWSHYTAIGHIKGSSIVYYMLPGGRIITHPFVKKADNHDADGYEAQAIAVGRIDPKSMKISVRTPLAPGNAFYAIPQAKLDYIVRKLKPRYPDYEIWYFGNAATDIRRIDEAVTPLSDDDLRQRGYQDGLRGKYDLKFLGLGRPNERSYWEGFEHGKFNRPRKPRAAPIRQLRRCVPITLKNHIKDADLIEAYNLLRDGHALDGVRKIEARDAEESITNIADALQEIARRFSGTIRLYRTIQVDDDPHQWVEEHMQTTQHLGRYWSTEEDWVMAHETHERVLFCVDAPGDVIDWPETIVTTADGVEGEVRLLVGKQIRLRYVEPEPGFTPESSQLV